MAIDPAQAEAERTLGEETFYFCSQRCAGRFDHEHASSTDLHLAGSRVVAPSRRDSLPSRPSWKLITE
jgi:YHS domain-containing protein